ncbi:hypothetical protein LDHU3_14.1480:CDS1 [Leishmania donovani]|uniref:Hypothetical_protein n=1 Tax=Leishmania donovani TaxID=5661 RepID=A0A6J8FA97_LEIDO|nr:hypothetical protein LDHU3_14.1480:CDS1 [Leishmania donovani]VDZ43272.1 hypothetical_protein [Leishmania donovani]
MLHALAATPTRERLRSAAAASDAVHVVSHLMTTRQLLDVIRDLVVFAWPAIEVRRRQAEAPRMVLREAARKARHIWRARGSVDNWHLMLQWSTRSRTRFSDLCAPPRASPHSMTFVRGLSSF